MTERATPGNAEEVTSRPRRLTHGNFYVADLERSSDFYEHVVGLHRVYVERELRAAFFSNGNSHHDVALMEVSGQARIGRDGQTQTKAGRGARPGLNHIAFEMESEGKLVHAAARARSHGVRLDRSLDHIVSHSIYVFDPDGNCVELYADSTDDWRRVYQNAGDGLITSQWDVPEVTDASDVSYLDPAPVEVPPGNSLFRPLRANHGCLVVGHLGAGLSFYRDAIGLEVLHGSEAAGWVVLAGGSGTPCLTLFAQQPGHHRGFHHLGLAVGSADELDACEDRARSQGVPLIGSIDDAVKRSVTIADPDGVALEFVFWRNDHALEIDAPAMALAL